MRRLSFLLISTGLYVGAAQAGTMAPSDVAATLAKSHTLDVRCNILAESDRQDLMDFLARAEILLAERESVGVARAALAKGKAQGSAGACGPDQEKFVKDILSAARASTTEDPPVQQAAEPPDVTPQPLPPKQVEASKPTEPAASPVALKPSAKASAKTAVAEPKANKKKAETPKLAVVEKKNKAKTVAVSTPPSKKKGSTALAAYAGLAERYYVELKCRNMNGGAVRQLYANVLANHKQAVAENGPGAVRSVLRSAESRANASRCS